MSAELLDYASRVAAGAAFLDSHAPGWDSKIDLEELNLRFCSQCLLGQLYGHFLTGVKALSGESGFNDKAEKWADSLGFYLYEVPDEFTPEYSRLTQTWINLIQERRSACGA